MRTNMHSYTFSSIQLINSELLGVCMLKNIHQTYTDIHPLRKRCFNYVRTPFTRRV